MNNTKNILSIGISNVDFFNIMLTYYPKNLNENFNIILFVDNDKNILSLVKEVIENNNIKVFNNAEIIVIEDMISEYVERNNISKEGFSFLKDYKACFKLIAPIYIKNKYNPDYIYFSDDDVLILKDLSDLFNKYKTWTFKYSGGYVFQKDNTFNIIEEFEKIFNTKFKNKNIESTSVNSGTIIYECRNGLKDYKKSVDKFIESKKIQDIFYKKLGDMSWTLEQRFQQFNAFYRKEKIKFFKEIEVVLVTSVGTEKTVHKYFKNKPYLMHYPIGYKKNIWLNKFLKDAPSIFPNTKLYRPVKELKNSLYEKTHINNNNG